MPRKVKLENFSRGTSPLIVLFRMRLSAFGMSLTLFSLLLKSTRGSDGGIRSSGRLASGE